MLTGQERDLESGLDHVLYRQYASSLGRWTVADPVTATAYEPQSLNRYGHGFLHTCPLSRDTDLFLP